MSQVQQADPIVKAAVTTPGYASIAKRKGRAGTRFWLPIVVVAVLGTGASLGLRAGGYLDGIFGTGGADGLYHFVQPMDFNIILTEDGEQVLAVLVISVFSRGARNFVFVRRPGGAKPVEVRLDRSNTSFVEVTDGLKSGDRVLMHVTDDLLAMLPKVRPGEELARQAKAANARQGAARPVSGERRMGSGRGRPTGGASGRPTSGGGRRPGGAGKRGGGGGG